MTKDIDFKAKPFGALNGSSTTPNAFPANAVEESSGGLHNRDGKPSLMDFNQDKETQLRHVNQLMSLFDRLITEVDSPAYQIGLLSRYRVRSHIYTARLDEINQTRYLHGADTMDHILPQAVKNSDEHERPVQLQEDNLSVEGDDLSSNMHNTEFDAYNKRYEGCKRSRPHADLPKMFLCVIERCHQDISPVVRGCGSNHLNRSPPSEHIREGILGANSNISLPTFNDDHDSIESSPPKISNTNPPLDALSKSAMDKPGKNRTEEELDRLLALWAPLRILEEI